MVKKFFILLLVMCGSVELRAADRDDVYGEFVASTSLNVSGRHRFAGQLGYVVRDDLGVGISLEELYSSDLETLDKSGFRGALEFRWFQEPFEFAADVGLLRRMLRDSRSQNQASLAVTTAYLFALTPSLAAKADFSFLFLDQPRVLFSGGVGARLLF